MAEVTRTPRATADLDEIWYRVALDDPEAADRLIDRIVERCGQLASHPEPGPARPDIARDALMLTVGDYLNLYRIQDGGVDIVRVVHRARRLRRLFEP